MKRENRRTGKKERAIMIASTAFVLTALSVTGVYLKNENVKNKDDGYTIDFTTMQKTPQNQYLEDKNRSLAAIDQEIEDDLDYMPMEVGGDSVILPEVEKKQTMENVMPLEEILSKEAEPEPEESIEEVFVDTTIHFPGAGQILNPIDGDVLIPYSMDKGVYFTTLDQYKYNPAVIYGADQGTVVAVCADSVVEDISFDPVTGYTVLLDLGDGYKAIYGQMDQIAYCVGDMAVKGTVLGYVAEPTKYFSKEGANLYFAMEYNGSPLDPSQYFMY